MSKERAFLTVFRVNQRGAGQLLSAQTRSFFPIVLEARANSPKRYAIFNELTLLSYTLQRKKSLYNKKI
ncbi:TPA: hypothetical protein ACOM1H_003196 [Escherichia coli]|uniref:hypothetical protein n=1 Tax=Escherichia coli TaxID=562 RepID=UPI00033C1F04|nr:hypothetical protein [Escherichia coli]EEG6630745.1 hypothetical protein [Salmonella enterica subsp. enterica serovar Typhimurium]EJF3939375.1 hypothetical protein [Salmonella enterica]EOV55890.1 hypothetical protein A1SU_00417 [Escherichia coli KTE61]EHV9293030.1 hypothetical protein [Salmonella enterica subsp. enterica serovar Typhimurium]NNT96210.1 hypothetical protein [Escherichia coli]